MGGCYTNDGLSYVGKGKNLSEALTREGRITDYTHRTHYLCAQLYKEGENAREIIKYSTIFKLLGPIWVGAYSLGLLNKLLHESGGKPFLMSKLNTMQLIRRILCPDGMM